MGPEGFTAQVNWLYLPVLAWSQQNYPGP